MTSTDLKDSPPVFDAVVPETASPTGSVAAAAIDVEDEQVVPVALTSFVAAARHTHALIKINGHYPPQVALAAIEDVAAALVRITTNVAAYVGDYSSAGGRAMTRAGELLARARTEFSDARHHLSLDEDTMMEPPLSAGLADSLA